MNTNTIVLIVLGFLLLAFVAYSVFGKEAEGLDSLKSAPPPTPPKQVDQPQPPPRQEPVPKPLDGFPHLIILPKKDVLNLLSDYNQQTGKKFDVVISIQDGRDAKFEDAVKKMSKHPYFMYFVDSPDEHPHGPREDHARQIMKIATSHKTAEGFLLHCQAGISRSTAAALLVMDAWGISAQVALGELQRIRPQAQPNAVLTKFMPQEYKAVLQGGAHPQSEPDIEYV